MWATLQLSELGHKFGRALSRFVQRQRKAFAEAQRIEKMEEIKQFEQFESADEDESGTSLTKTLSETSQKYQQSQGRFVIWTSMLQRAVQTVESFNAAEYDIKVCHHVAMTRQYTTC
jgi:6-phosphofructo-2-kinase